jgi:hypothetical protein
LSEGDKMDCPVCKNHQRDINDVERRIGERLIDHNKMTKTTAERDNMASELHALASAKSHIESNYLKHRRLAQH